MTLQDSYTGQFKKGQMHGYGVYQKDGGNTYEGQWRDDEMCGEGTLVFANKDRFQGIFVDGKQHGAGRYFPKHGDSWTGVWDKGSLVCKTGPGGEDKPKADETEDGKLKVTGTLSRRGTPSKGVWVELSSAGIMCIVRAPSGTAAIDAMEVIASTEILFHTSSAHIKVRGNRKPNYPIHSTVSGHALPVPQHRQGRSGL